MRPQNKYLRRLIHRQKMESLYEKGAHVLGTHIEFITKNPDPSFIRPFKIEDSKARGRHYYSYWDKPNVPYTMIKRYQSFSKRYYKDLSKRKVRKSKNLYQGNSYRKLYDLWNSIW